MTEQSLPCHQDQLRSQKQTSGGSSEICILFLPAMLQEESSLTFLDRKARVSGPEFHS